jgi:cytochrome b561
MHQTARYHNIAILLHWVMALLIIGLIALGYFLDDIPKEYRGTAYMLHKSFGITVLALTLVRLGWRLGHKPPAYALSMRPYEKMAAKGTHWLFYALMIIMPLSGWLMTSAGGKYPIHFFNLFTVPFLPMPDGVDTKMLGGIFHETHEISALWVGIALITLHILAALKHQFIDKTPMLSRMKPKF